MSKSEIVLSSLAGIFVLGVGSQWVASRLRIPSIILLLATGLLAGPVAKLIQPDELFGDLMLPLVSLSVAIILFEGSMSLRMSDLRSIGRPLIMLLSVGVAVTWILSSIGGVWVLGFPLSVALLLGAILTVTGPTVIGPMLREIRPTGRSGPIARWEGIVVDPIGAVLAVLVYRAHDAIQNSQFQNAAVSAAFGFTGTMLAGIVIGSVLALSCLLLLSRHWIADHLQSPFALMLVIGGFTVSNLIWHESGLVTVTAMGLILANQRRVPVKHIFEFKESLSILLISNLFILLTARLSLDSVLKLGLRGVGFVMFLIVVVRPASVWISTVGSGLRTSERIFLSWLAPRGIVAAAVASVFALDMTGRGLPGDEFASAMFLVIVGTVLVYGSTSGPLARRLGLSLTNPQGLVIASAHPGARAIAVALHKEKIPVVLVDTNSSNLAAARMEGLRVFHADVLSEAMREDIDLGGIGRLLALTPNDEVNGLAARQFSELFGRSEVYRLRSGKEGTDRRQKSGDVLSGRVAFGNEVTYQYLDDRFEAGAVVKVTRLTPEFTPDDYRSYYGANAILLFVIDEQRRLTVATADQKLSPKVGQTLISLTDIPKTTPQQSPEVTTS